MGIFSFTKFSLGGHIYMVLYSTNCPKCKVLEMKLKKKNIDYSVFSDVEAMMEMGIKAAPILELDDG